MDEFDELEIEVIAAAEQFDNHECRNDQNIDEYDNCGVVPHSQHYVDTGSGCLLIISTWGFLITMLIMWLILPL